MQEMRDPETGKILREYFADTKGGRKAMDERLAAQEARGLTLVRRAKIGRNDPCPCDSGKKFKKCCGRAIR